MGALNVSYCPVAFRKCTTTKYSLSSSGRISDLIQTRLTDYLTTGKRGRRRHCRVHRVTAVHSRLRPTKGKQT